MYRPAWRICQTGERSTASPLAERNRTLSQRSALITGAWDADTRRARTGGDKRVRKCASACTMPCGTLNALVLHAQAAMSSALLRQRLDAATTHTISCDPVCTATKAQKMSPIDDPDKTVPFLRQTLDPLRQETEGKATLLGFIGSPFTLGAHAVEGKAHKNFFHTKRMMHNEPAILHAFLDPSAQTSQRTRRTRSTAALKSCRSSSPGRITWVPMISISLRSPTPTRRWRSSKKSTPTRPSSILPMAAPRSWSGKRT